MWSKLKHSIIKPRAAGQSVKRYPKVRDFRGGVRNMNIDKKAAFLPHLHF